VDLGRLLTPMSISPTATSAPPGIMITAAIIPANGTASALPESDPDQRRHRI